jgi:uncharacterized coiled-coil DUF342 family protein
MRNRAHLSSSPHFDDVANIVANLKAFVSNAIAASAKKAIARRHKPEAERWASSIAKTEKERIELEELKSRIKELRNELQELSEEPKELPGPKPQ